MIEICKEKKKFISMKKKYQETLKEKKNQITTYLSSFIIFLI